MFWKESQSQHQSDTTDPFHAPMHPCLPLGPLKMSLLLNRSSFKPSPKTLSSSPPPLKTRSPTAPLCCFVFFLSFFFFGFHGRSDTCTVNEGDVCWKAWPDEKQRGEKHVGIHCFHMITRFSRETATLSSSSLLISRFLKMLPSCFSRSNTPESLISTTYDISS